MSSPDSDPGAPPDEQPVREVPRPLLRFLLVFVAAAVPILGLVQIAIRRAAETAEHEGRERGLTVARLGAASAQGVVFGLVTYAEAYARRPRLLEICRRRDASGAQALLAELVMSHARVDRAFLTDPTGMLWADHPPDATVRGRRFADRDWYRGVTAARGTYASRFYTRSAGAREVLAIATPVPAPGQGPAAYLVAQMLLTDLEAELTASAVGWSGGIVVLDRDGQGAPTAREQMPEPVRASLARWLAAGAPGGAPGRHWVAGDHLVAAAGVPVFGGAVVTFRSRERALGGARALARLLASAALAVAALLACVAYLALESRRRGIRQHQRSKRDLESRVARRTAELTRVNEELRREIASRRSLEDQVRHGQKMEAVGRLAAGVAHDFNNVLTVIGGHAELLLLRMPQATSETRAEIEEIRRAAERAAALTRQLLAFGRKQILEPRVLDLNAVVRDMERMLRRLIGEDVELVATLAADLDRVRADPGQLEQVIANLAVNARDAMPQGGRLTIETANVEVDEDVAGRRFDFPAGRYVVLAVTDTGVGMDRETQSHVFEPFFTTKGPGEGTGLGLATVYGIVKQSGGHVWFYSEPGAGTCFKVHLPAVREAAAAPLAAPEARQLGGGETILVVEDELAVRSLAKEVLASYGYRVFAASGAEEAQALWERAPNPIDLLVTDVVLPRISGGALAAALLEKRPDLRVLFMSGYTEDAVVRHGILEEGVAFLSKPFSPQALARKVRDVLDAPPLPVRRPLV